MQATESTKTEEAVVEKKVVWFLGHPDAAKAVAKNRPQIAALFKGAKVKCRSLGASEHLPQLQQADISSEDTIVGFNIPIGIAARAESAFEVPLGSVTNRANKTNQPWTGDVGTEMVKALSGLANVPIRQWVVEMRIAATSQEDTEQADLEF